MTAGHLFFKNFIQSPGEIGILGCVFTNTLRIDLIDGDLIFSLADQIGNRNHRVAHQFSG